MILLEKCFVHNIFTIFSQQILNGRLLLIAISGKKSNVNFGFKLELIITYHLVMIYCENVVDVTLLFFYSLSFLSLLI